MKKYRLLIILILFGFVSQAQQTDSVPEKKYVRPGFFRFGVGPGSITFRDFATSPLFYTGPGMTITLGRLRKDENIEAFFEAATNIAMPINSYNNTSNAAIYFGMDLSYYRLYRINRFSVGKLNTKVGGNILTSDVVRLNSSLGNNSLGFENIMNLAGSAKVTYDISRKVERTMKIWFLKKKLKVKKRDISYMLNVGILNTNFRPGYAYSYDAYDGQNFNWFADYRFSMNGMRIKWRLDYTKYIFNGNATQISIIHDLYTAPGKFEDFQFSQSSIMISWLFNNK